MSPSRVHFISSESPTQSFCSSKLEWAAIWDLHENAQNPYVLLKNILTMWMIVSCKHSKIVWFFFFWRGVHLLPSTLILGEEWFLLWGGGGRNWTCINVYLHLDLKSCHLVSLHCMQREAVHLLCSSVSQEKGKSWKWSCIMFKPRMWWSLKKKNSVEIKMTLSADMLWADK